MTDLLQKNQFTLTFAKIPDTVLTCQKAPIPSVRGSSSKVGTPFSWLKEPDTKMEFDPWTTSFKLDENLDAYLNVFDWMTGLYFPRSFDEYNNLKGEVEESNRRNLFSDATLTILDNTNHANLRVIFKDMFPIFLSEVPFETDVLDAAQIDVTATFEYHSFKIEKLT